MIVSGYAQILHALERGQGQAGDEAIRAAASRGES